MYGIAIILVILWIWMESGADGASFADWKNQNYTQAVVIWSGMGSDSALTSYVFDPLLHEMVGPNVYVKALKVGGNVVSETINSFLMPIHEQVDLVCKEMREDPILRQVKVIDMIGLSQGGQFSRAYVQRCNDPKIRNLITFSGQHMGVFGVPHCAAEHSLCDLMRDYLELGAYNPLVQSRLVQAQYWNDPLHPNEYLKSNIWLPGILNQIQKNDTYIKNLQSLNKFIMVMNTDDTMVIPKESSHFRFYKQPFSEQKQEIIPLQESPVYDSLGLRRMDKEGKLVFLQTSGDHLHFTREWFQKEIVPYLKL